MIKSFADKGTEDIFFGDDTKAARKTHNPVLWPRAPNLLDKLHAAKAVGDLRLPPSNRLHQLKGDLKGYWSLSINEKYRIIFKLEGGDAYEVRVVDYH